MQPPSVLHYARYVETPNTTDTACNTTYFQKKKRNTCVWSTSCVLIQVALVFLTVVILLGAAALIPAYVKVSTELADVEALRDKEAFEQEVEEYKNAETTLTDTARELSVLRKKILEISSHRHHHGCRVLATRRGSSARYLV